MNSLIKLEELDWEDPRSPRTSLRSLAASRSTIHHNRLKRQQKAEFLETPRRNVETIKLLEFSHDKYVAESGVYGARSAPCHIEYNDRGQPL